MTFCVFFSRRVDSDTFSTYPNFDYLGDIQDSLLEMEGDYI